MRPKKLLLKNCLLYICFCFTALCLLIGASLPVKASAINNYTDSIRRAKTMAMATCPGIDWATWNNINGSYADAKINTPNGQVTVTMATSSNMGESNDIYDYPKFAASTQGVPNSRVPKMIWGTGNQARTDVCFSRKVSNPVMVIASLGSSFNNNHTSLNFSEPYIVLYDGGGMTYDHANKLTGFEGFAIILFPGEHDCIAITSDNEEYYSNVTWGLSPVTSPVSIDVPYSACGTATLQAVGGDGVSYKWYGGGEAPNAASNRVYQSGNYMVAVTDANGCTNYAKRSLAISLGGPPATINGTPTGCNSVTLTAGAGESYQWSGGATPTERENTFTTSGKYSVVITQADGCVSYAEQAVTVGPPDAIISGNSTSCGSITLTASGGQTYLWDGGNSPNTANNTFTQSGTYSVLVTNAAGCAARVSKTITVTGPILNVTGNTTDCDNVTLTASGAAYYLWDGGLTPTDATNTFTKSGTYTLFASDVNGCSSTVKKTVVVSNSAAGVTGVTTNCEKVTLTASGGVAYSWNGGLTPGNAVNTFTVGGVYTVTITSADGCKANISTTVTISPPYPILITTGDCGSTTITASGWKTYVWDGGETPISATNTFKTSGVYHLTLTDVSGCETTIPVTITVDPPFIPVVNITADTQVPVCAGTLIKFTATGSNEGRQPLYEWFNNNTKVGEGKTYSATNLSNGDRITCRLTAVKQCTVPPQATSDPIIAQITAAPIITFDQSLVITDENPLQLNPGITGNIVSYRWSPATGLSDATIKSPLANPEATTTYTLTATSATGCDGSQDVTVTVALGMNRPNTFTPNADGVNDVWTLNYLAKYPNARVDIYNRYGKQVFHSVGYKKPWDGTLQGKPLPAGVYYYVIDLKTAGQKQQTGYITVLR